MGTAETVKVFIENQEVPWESTGPGMKRKIMAWDEKLMLVKVHFEKGAVGALHQHPHTQITHIENGVFEVEIGDEKKILKVERFEFCLGTITKQSFYFQQMFTGAPVHNRIRATGIIAYHPSYHGTISCGSFRSKK